MRRYLSIFIIGLLVLIAVLFNILVFQYRGEIASLQKKAVDLNSALALVNEQLSNESYLASEQATEIASLYQSAAELESDKENLQGKFDALNLTSIKLQDDLKAQLRESSNLRKVGLCSNINLSIEINYKSNSTVSESLKKFVGDRRVNETCYLDLPAE